MVKFVYSTLFFVLFSGCAGPQYHRTASSVDLSRFMKKWYVIAGRFTWLERGAHNAVEVYSYNNKKSRIDIDFYFNKDSFDGPLKKIPQKAWVEDTSTNAHWKVSPFWPLKFDYLVIAVADDYSWTAIGVPSKEYLWIMADTWDMSEEKLKEILQKLSEVGYPTQEVIRVPQRWR